MAHDPENQPDGGVASKPANSSRAPLQLQGFNNLTKTLTFNLYSLRVAETPAQRVAYLARVDQDFGSARISQILRDIAQIIGAQVLSVSTQDYEPHGASALMLMSDEGQGHPDAPPGASTPQGPPSVAVHLDKSHLCAHTYPDWEDPQGVCSLRVDIEVSTCGTIMPLRALNYMLEALGCDVATVDYTVRGFTRDTQGRRVYLDHSVDSILDFVDPAILARFEAQQLSMAAQNTWQAKLMRRQVDGATHLPAGTDPASAANLAALERLSDEMRAIYASR